MLTPEKTEDFILGRLPEPETLALLKHLTPDVVDTQTFQLLLETMSKTASPLPQLDELDIIDCCGTGGSGRTHFNTSTTVAFVLAAAGLPVVKFGNRGLTSKSGSFDFLEALGLTAEIPLDHIGDLLQEGGVTFLYAPQCYPALAPFNQLRRGLGTRTVFNYLGPMLNPVKPTYRLLGVSQIDMQEKIANRLLNDASSKRAWVVSGPKGMDELMPVGTNIVMAVENQSVKVQELSVDWTGPPLDEDTVLSPKENVKIFQRLIQDQDSESIYYKLVCLNAGAALLIAGKAEDLKSGMVMAGDLLQYGEVYKTVKKCRKAYKTFGVKNPKQKAKAWWNPTP